MNTNYKFPIKIIKNEWEILWSKDENKYTLLYKAIKNSILSGTLPHNWILPSTRQLSVELMLSRTTVIKAYELLHLEKLVLAKGGSGYRINYDKSKDAINKKSDFDFNLESYPKLSDRAVSFKKNYPLLNRPENENVAFRPGLPPLDAFPVNQWKHLLNNYWRYIKSSNLSYAQTTGINALKKSIKDFLYVSRNIRCHEDQIIITSGSLQSLYIIGNALVNAGDSIVLENPSFPNVHSIFKSLNASIQPVSIDGEGLDIHQLKQKRIDRPKIIHLTPSNHYPLGIKMSVLRRQELLKWASENKAIIVENDYENEIANHQEKTPTVFSLDKENRVVYMGTFNRLLHPSIRLGFMVVPEFLIETVNALQEHSHRFVAPSIQVVMNQFIAKNYLYKHMENIIKIARQRHELFIKFFNENKSMYLVNAKFCSLHVVAKFSKQDALIKEKEVIKLLYENNITAFPLSKCYITKEGDKGLIFGYSAVHEHILNKKLNILKNIIP